MNHIPSLYYFNPTCELAVANGSPYYMPPEHLRVFSDYLAPILTVFAMKSDYILSPHQLSDCFSSLLQQFHFYTGTFINESEINELVPEISPVIAWGKSPAASNFIKKNGRLLEWDNRLRYLYSREASMDFLNNFLTCYPDKRFLQKNSTARIIKSAEEIELLFNEWGPVVLKAPFSSSGRGLQVLRKQHLNQSNLKWIASTIKQQGFITAEKWLDKIQDLSFQFKKTKNGHFEYLGTTYFQTNSNGQYQSHLLHQSPIDTIQEQLLRDTAEKLRTMLDKSEYKHHEGFLGIDALFFQEDDELKLHPCVEINTRMNMGIVSLYIEKKIHPQAKGSYHIYYHPKKSFNSFIKEQLIENPPKMNDNLLIHGIFPLSDFDSEIVKIGAYILLD